VLLQLEPLSGPLEGGTALTVDGENLGLSANDTSVSVAGLNCDVVQYHSPVRSQILPCCFISSHQSGGIKQRCELSVSPSVCRMPIAHKNSSGDEIANVNFYAVRSEVTGIR